jgi:hypothetical protein
MCRYILLPYLISHAYIQEFINYNDQNERQRIYSDQRHFDILCSAIKQSERNYVPFEEP